MGRGGVALFFITALLVLGHAPCGESVAESASTEGAWVAPDVGRHFRALGVRGSVLVEDLQGNRLLEYGAIRSKTPFLPASTFKIFNSLVALETGVVADESAVFPWDGKDRGVAQWNRDLSMREAFRVSAVWYYQELARRIGKARMQEFIDRVGYGNRNIGGAIDTFWLEGELRITPEEQIAFLRRLYRGDLPFSARTLAIVKDIMIRERTERYVFRSKTGWAQQTGWLVGYLEQGGSVYFFATVIDIRDPKDLGAREEITRRSIQDLGLL